MSAETWLGAAACAPGSQKWSGSTPAFMPNPHRASATAAVAAPPTAARPAMAEKSYEPAIRPSSANMANRARFPAWAAAR